MESRIHSIRVIIFAAVVLVSSGCSASPEPALAPIGTEPGTGFPSVPPTPTHPPAATFTPAPTPTPITAESLCDSASSHRVEIFSWWLGPGEVDALNAFVNAFKSECPNLRVANSAAAAGSAARALLEKRLSANDAPDSWQAPVGQGMIASRVSSGKIAPLDELYKATGLGEALPAELVALISQNGHPYGVPVDIHRSNILWYNPKILARAGVTSVPIGYDEFLAACQRIEATGKVCLALGPQWTAMHLLENVMLGTLGPDKWSGLWTGEGDWSSPEVTAAIETYAKVLSHTNADHQQLPEWQSAAKLMINNYAAFNVMGDWAYSYFTNPAPNGLARKPHTDFDWAPAPGTGGSFMFLADAFVLPANAQHPDASMAWLTFAASKRGQEAFNPLKGSICARTDCDPSLFGDYSRAAAADWSTDTLVGSLTHSVVANDAWRADIDRALGTFLSDPTKAAEFQDSLEIACQVNGPCR